jgi:hypothetical protein
MKAVIRRVAIHFTAKNKHMKKKRKKERETGDRKKRDQCFLYCIWELYLHSPNTPSWRGA